MAGDAGVCSNSHKDIRFPESSPTMKKIEMGDASDNRV